MKLRKKKKKGFTLIELLAVIVVLAIIMIIAIPNILNTMSTSKKQSLKVYAEKMFNEAQKKYEQDRLTSNVTLPQTYNITTLAPNQNKYTGSVALTSDGNNGYTMAITITDGEFKICSKSPTAINTSSNIEVGGSCS